MSFDKIKKYIWLLFLIIAIILLISALANLKEDKDKFKAENKKAYNLLYIFAVFIVLALISFFVFNIN